MEEATDVRKLIVPEGMICSNCLQLADTLVVSVTDTHHSETEYLCEACYSILMNEIQANQESLGLKHCELCGLQKDDVVPTKDPEEGSSGRLYDACRACRTRMVNDFVAGDDLDSDEWFDED